MLKTILSISGKPGLFKLVSHGKNMLIVESLTDKKRVPAYAKDKVISLGDIAIYTTETEVPLHEVLKNCVLILLKFYLILTAKEYIPAISKNY